MDAVVLVGGFGTRLRPLTLTVPKNLVPVAGVPLIERVVGWLAGHGVDRVVLAMGYQPDRFFEAFPDGTAAGVPLVYAVEPEPLDTGGAIRFAARHAGVDGTFIVANGDVLTEMDLTSLVAAHRRTGAEGTLALTPVDDPSRFGVVPTDADGRVTAFLEKPPRDEAPTNLINAGTYVLEASVIDRIADGRKVSVEREVFPAVVADSRLYAVPSEAWWIDVGVPEALLSATADLLSGRFGAPLAGALRASADGPWVVGSPQVAPGAEVDGRSLLEAGAVVDASAVVRGSAVGPGAHVGEGATVDGAVLLAGAVVEAGATVVASVVGPGARVGAGATLGGLSIVGEGAVVAPGSTLDGGRVAAT